MSKYQIIGAKEDFNEATLVPARALIIRSNDAKDNNFSYERKIYFPEHHASLLINGVLYDWYGKEVKLSEDIKKVIEPIGLGSTLTNVYETYLVKRKDDRMAIAKLFTSKEGKKNVTIKDHIISEITGRIMEYGQELEPEDWSFDNVLGPDEIKQTCFSNFKYGEGEYMILLDVKDEVFPEKEPKILFYPTTETYVGPIGNYIFKDKASSLNIGVQVEYANFLRGRLKFSDDGRKATAISPKGYRISTDTETLLRAGRNMAVSWYLDPVERGEDDG